MDLTNKKRKNGFDRASVLDLSTLVYGKVPPQAKGLEEVVLGAILLEKGAFDVAAEILTAEAFYVDGHQRIFRAMQSLALKSKPIDILTLEEELRTKEDLDLIGGPYYLTKLTNSVVSAANIETHARIIHEKFLKREQIRICGEGLNMAYEDSTDAFECLDHLSGKIGELAMVGVSSDGQDIASVLVERVQYLHEMNDRVDEVIGIPTGFPILDKITRGWIAGYLIILAARPSVGKTALALNLARNAAADLNKPTAVAYWSLEMGAGELTDRMISAESGVSYEDISKARLSEDQMRRLYLQGVQPLSRYNIFMDYTPSLNIIELRAKARKWVKTWRNRPAQNGKPECKDGLIIIDYLQLMNGVKDNMNSQTRDQELSIISRSLKTLAGELQVPIIALSQMSREIEKRQGGKPKLSDLRESGAIEQDADIVAFLQREDYEQADYEVDEMDKDKAFIWFKKHRNGRLERVTMRTALEVQRWLTPEQYDMYQRNLRSLREIVGNGKGPNMFRSPVVENENEGDPF